jgi:hypothetical protein
MSEELAEELQKKEFGELKDVLPPVVGHSL